MNRGISLTLLIVFVALHTKAWQRTDGPSSPSRKRCLQIFSSTLIHDQVHAIKSTVSIKDTPQLEYESFRKELEGQPLEIVMLRYEKLLLEIIKKPELKWLYSNVEGKSFFSDRVLVDSIKLLKSHRPDFAEVFRSFHKDNQKISVQEVISLNETFYIYFLTRLAQLSLFNEHLAYKETHTVYEVKSVIYDLFIIAELLKKVPQLKLKTHDNYQSSVYDKMIQASFKYLKLIF